MPQRIIPMLAYEDAAAAIDWLGDAFGFRESGERYTDDDGVVTHAELELDGAEIMLSTPTPDYCGPNGTRRSASRRGGGCDNPWVIDGCFVEVEDVDAHHCAGGGGRRDDPARAGGAGDRLPDLLGGGPRGSPLDVRPATRMNAARTC